MAIEKAVNVTISAQDRFSGTMSSLGGAWGAIAKGALAAEAAILAASIAAAKFSIDIGKDVVDSAVDFRDAIYDVTAVAQSFGTTGEDISNILDDLVNRFPVTGREAGEALEKIAQLGFGAKEELAGLTEEALNLSIATGRDLDTAVGLLGATMNIFNLNVEDSTRLMNLFAATQFTSAASIDDLNIAMTYAGPIMKAAGQSVEATAAAIGILRNNGLEASQAGTTLRRAITQLYKETDKGTAVLQKYGLTYDDVNPSTNTFAEIIDKLDDKFFSAKDAVDLFGVRAVIMGNIINDGADAFRAYEASITNTSLGVDALEEKLKKFEVVMNNLGGSMDIFKKTIGEDLADAIAEFVGYDEKSGLRGVITYLYEMEKAHGAIGAEFVGTFEDVKEILGSAFKDAFPDMNSFYNWLVDVAAAARVNVNILASFFGAVAEGAVSSTKNNQVLIEMLELVRIALVALTTPLALIHDAFVLIYAVGKEALEGIGGIAAWLDLKFAEFAINALTYIAKIPIIGNTDAVRDALAYFGRQMVTAREAVEKGFSIEPVNLWYDNVLKASSQSRSAIEAFAKSSKSSFDDMTPEAKTYQEQLENLTKELATGDDTVRLYGETSEKVFRNISTHLESTAGAADDSKVSIEELAAKLKVAGIAAEVTAEGTLEIKDASLDTLNAVGAVTSAIEEQEIPIKKTKEGFVQIGEAVDDTSKYITTSKEGVTLLSNEMGETTNHVISIKDGVISVSEKVDELNKKGGLDLKTADAKTKLEVFKTTISDMSDIIQTKIEWEAKLEIAQLEADAEKAVAAFETIGDSVVAAADATAGMFGDLADIPAIHFSEAMDLVERQLAVEEALAAAQIALTNEQTEYLRLANERLKRGEAAAQVNVTVDGDMEGWLAGLMESLFNDIMVKASSEAFNVLAQG
jgi:TP901 family phage tail tape measure protein